MLASASAEKAKISLTLSRKNNVDAWRGAEPEARGHIKMSALPDLKDGSNIKGRRCHAPTEAFDHRHQNWCFLALISVLCG